MIDDMIYALLMADKGYFCKLLRAITLTRRDLLDCIRIASNSDPTRATS